MASPHIGLIVTGANALSDYKVFCKTLEVWHPDATLYVFTDSETPVHTVAFKGTAHVKVALDAYKGLTRQDMERRPGVLYNSLFKDYTYEKANVLDWMWSMSPALPLGGGGAWFLDADICFLAPLPAIPATATIALSPHSIRPSDERLYGRYNAGFMWFKSSEFLASWRAAAPSSRFFEQAALEDLAAAAGSSLYEFPLQVNFGWWRMFQSTDPPAAIAAKFSLFRADRSVGIRYEGKALQSVHTHWYQKDGSATDAFNRFLKDFVARFPTHKPLAQFGRAV